MVKFDLIDFFCFDLKMNDSQKQAFSLVQSGKNIFLTGPAGSGKSYLIRHIVEWVESQGKKVGLTALTGCAALLLGQKAKTLHSWAGIGLGRESVDVLATIVSKSIAAKKRWKQVSMLIIDEVSMMTPELLEKLDIIGKRIRNNAAPWGGIQLVLCGDFFQLPPVMKGLSGESTSVGRFAFESPTWNASQLIPVVLTKIERQTDEGFQQILNECRIGELSSTTCQMLESRKGLDWKSLQIRPTLLFSRNTDVDTINEKNIVALNKPIVKYDVQTVIIQDPLNPLDIPVGEELERIEQRLDHDANYVPHLELCLNAQVMLISNLDIEAGLVNGSRGVIVGFYDDKIPIVKFMYGDPIPIAAQLWQSNEYPIVYRSQIPLRVAYAITIHKSQGATLDCALIDIGKSTFEFGQAYVALSRVRNLGGLYIWNLDTTKIQAHPTVVSFYRQIMENTHSRIEQHNICGFGAELEDEGWRQIVSSWSNTIKGRACLDALNERSKQVRVFPEPQNILAAVKFTRLSDVKVVILGQDPYHGSGQAHGLSFSVLPGTAMPPSLRNIRKELLNDLGVDESFWPSSYGSLINWAKRGVLLLNTTLTVEEGKPNSHEDLGWDDLTQRLLGAVVSENTDRPIVFLAWGRNAQGVIRKLRLGPKHLILEAAHPSPLSVSCGFFGSRPFSKANEHLKKYSVEPIDWRVQTGDYSEDPR